MKPLNHWGTLRDLRHAMTTTLGRLQTWRQPGVVLVSLADAPPVPGTWTPDHSEALLAWRGWAKGHVGQRCVVGLSSRCVLHALVPEQGTARLSAAQALAAAAAEWSHYLGLGAQALSTDWCLRPARLPGGWLVCASPRALVDDLLAIAGQHGVQVAWMGPWWAQGLQRWLATGLHGQRHLHLQEPGWCVVADAQSGRLQGLHGGPVQPGSLGPGNRKVQVVPGDALVCADARLAPVVLGRDALWESAA